jgi:hypothetical protein
MKRLSRIIIVSAIASAFLFVPSQTVFADNSDSTPFSTGIAMTISNTSIFEFFERIPSDMVYTGLGAFLGAFLGFLASILLENLLRVIKRKKCIINVALELEALKMSLQDDLENDVFEFTLCTPIWDAVIQTGDILELRKKKYYDDLFLVYSSIGMLIKYEDLAHENNNFVKYEEKIIPQRKKIIMMLTSEDDYESDSKVYDLPEYEPQELWRLIENYGKFRAKGIKRLKKKMKRLKRKIDSVKKKLGARFPFFSSKRR